MGAKANAPASLLSLIETELPPRQDWITSGVLPQSGTLIFGGLAKIGKSFLMLELARAISTGTVPFGHPKLQARDPARVLYIEQEVGMYGLRDRSMRIMQEEDPAVYGPNLWYVTKVPQMQLNTLSGRSMLWDMVETVKPAVLMLDPIGRMHGYNENDNKEIQSLFTDLERLLSIHASRGMSLVISHHYGKPSYGPGPQRDPLDPYNFRGSSKFFDCVDSAITVQKLGEHFTPHKWWELKVRFETRQDQPPEEVLLTVNREDDRRVRFVKFIHADKPLAIENTVRSRLFRGGGGSDTIQ